MVCFLADFRDTWAFLDARVKDAFDIKKTIQEVILMLLLWLVRQVFHISIISKYHAWCIQNSQSSKFSGTVFGRSCQYRAGKLLSRVCRESFPEMSRGGNLCWQCFSETLIVTLKEMLYYTRLVITSYLSFISNLLSSALHSNLLFHLIIILSL